MSQIASEFSYSEFSSQAVSQIPWGTLVTVIIPKSKSHEEMLWYINQTHKNGWSRFMVLNQIAMKAYVFIFLDKNNIKNKEKEWCITILASIFTNIIIFIIFFFSSIHFLICNLN